MTDRPVDVYLSDVFKVLNMYSRSKLEVVFGGWVVLGTLTVLWHLTVAFVVLMRSSNANGERILGSVLSGPVLTGVLVITALAIGPTGSIGRVTRRAIPAWLCVAAVAFVVITIVEIWPYSDIAWPQIGEYVAVVAGPMLALAAMLEGIVRRQLREPPAQSERTLKGTDGF